MPPLTGLRARSNIASATSMTEAQSALEIEAYIAALPRRALTPPGPGSPSRYQVCSWPLLKPFNGFCGIERRRGGQLASWLLAAGCISLPARCDICGGDGPIGLHGENYYDVRRDPALCRPCHRALHFRSFQWEAWRRLVGAYTTTGSEWFALAPRNGLDLAKHLRSKFGWAVADIEHSPLSPLPDIIIGRLPDNMLRHPRLTGLAMNWGC